MVTELILETCIALRDGREQNACTAFSGIIAEAADNEALQAISCCLLVALRHRQRQLFAAWMQESRLRLEQLLVNLQLAHQGWQIPPKGSRAPELCIFRWHRQSWILPKR